MKTAGDETVLSLLPEKEAVTADELCYVRIAYTDADKTVKPLARGDVKIKVTGGRLIALGNGCSYMDISRSYDGDVTDTYYGEALAVIKPFANAETITVSGESPYSSASVEIPVKR